MRGRAIIGQALRPMQRDATPVMRWALLQRFQVTWIFTHACHLGETPVGSQDLRVCTSGALLEL